MKLLHYIAALGLSALPAVAEEANLQPSIDAQPFCAELLNDDRVPIQNISGTVRKGITYSYPNQKNDGTTLVFVGCGYDSAQEVNTQIDATLVNGPDKPVAKFVDDTPTPPNGVVDKVSLGKRPLLSLGLYGVIVQKKAQEVFNAIIKDARDRLRRGGFQPLGGMKYYFRKKS